jgi:hypothetical protein
MNDTTITTISSDTMKVLYFTIRTLHTATPGGYYIDIIAVMQSLQYIHTLLETEQLLYIKYITILPPGLTIFE